MALRSKAASKTEYNSRPFTKSNLAGRSFCLGVMPIPCPHFKITIVKRSQGQSAVAGAAYQSGERLFSEYDQRTKFYNKKKELVHAEIMLPSYAPPGYADRATLWNAVEAVENQWNSQLARRIVLAFPVEVPKEQYLSMIKEFCQEQFVSKGMIADFAIHDKGDGNPHAHILLTLRAIDEHGKWLPKARKVYDLDENGERIRLASGNWKCHKENTVDWNDQKYAEVWRHGWETITNRYLEAAGRPERVDLRSFERQGMLMLREDAEAIAQNVRNNLLTWKGEFPLNTDHGTDWERVVQQPRSEAVDEADSVVRSSIFQEPYVQEISSLSMTADGRALGVEFSGVLYNGETIRVEVNTGG